MRLFRVSAVLLLCSLAFAQKEQTPAPVPAPATRGREPQKKVQTPPNPLGDFDVFIAQTMKDWRVPGVGIAIVKDGKVLLSRGYGYRDVGKKLPVTGKTMFQIASITKSFTVATLASLVDEGKLEWDKPVRQFIPDFGMYDAVANNHITPRDLVTHRSGLPRHDAVWYMSDLSRDELVRRIRYLEPSRELRSNYQYNNLMFLTAGYLAGHVGKRSYEEIVRERVFAPLGMTRTNFTIADTRKSDDFALPYKRVKEAKRDEVVEVAPTDMAQAAPAGSINSCPDDMSQYLLMYLNKGVVGGKRIISESNITQMTSPQMVVPSSMRWSELGHSAYGMGLSIGSYRGHKLVSHGGALDGMAAQMMFLPQANIGVVVLTNLETDRNSTAVSIAYNVFDRLLGLDQVPWSERFMDLMNMADFSRAEAKDKGFSQKKPNTRPSHDIAEYAGTYNHPGYGNVTITNAGGELTMAYNLMKAPLKHFHYDIFETPEDPLNPLEQTKANFMTNEAGDIASVAIAMEPQVKAIIFERIADPSMRERSFLERLAGKYMIAGTVSTISIRGNDTLVLSTPGAPDRVLIPKRGMLFEVTGLSGYSIEFKADASGKVNELVYFQSGTGYTGKRVQ